MRDHEDNAMEQRYATGSIVLHWIMAALILTLFGLGWYMVGIPRGIPARGAFFNLHKSLGLVAMLFIAMFIGWRLRYTPPPHPDTMARWEMIGARLAHRLTYFFIIVVPLSGYVEANFTRYGIRFFGYPLAPWAGQNAWVSRWLTTVHVYCANTFAALIAIHVGAAIKHLVINRDRVLQRILPFG